MDEISLLINLRKIKLMKKIKTFALHMSNYFKEKLIQSLCF